MPQDALSSIIHTATMVLAARRRFMPEQHQQAAQQSTDYSTAQSLRNANDQAPALRLHEPSCVLLPQHNNQSLCRRYTGDVQHHAVGLSTEATAPDSANMNAHESASAQSRAVQVFNEIGAAVPSVQRSTRSPVLEVHAESAKLCCEQEGILTAIGTQLFLFMDRLPTVPRVKSSNPRPGTSGHKTNGQHANAAQVFLKVLDSDDNDIQESNLDYLSAVMANKGLCRWLQLTHHNKESLHRAVLTCEGLAVNFLFDHGASSDRVCELHHHPIYSSYSLKTNFHL